MDKIESVDVDQSVLGLTKTAKKRKFDPKVFLTTVDGGRTLAQCRKDEVIFSQGDPADAVFYIQKGKVKLVVTSRQGKQAVVAILGAGEFFGEGCLNGQPLRLATTTSMAESELMRVSKKEMIRVLHSEPDFSEMFTAHLLTRNSRIEEDLVDQLFNSSEKRLARTLLLLANFGKEVAPQPISTKITQDTARRHCRHDPAARQFLHEQRKETQPNEQCCTAFLPSRKQN